MTSNAQVQAHYMDSFHPGAYLNTYYRGLEGEEKFFLKSYHAVFTSGLLAGMRSVLDVGSGPSLITVVSASRCINDITMSDFVPENRNFLEKWLHGCEDAHDFTYLFKYVACLENNSNYQELEARVRCAVQGVININILKSNPIAPYKRTFDVLTCSLTMEFANASMKSYQRSLQNAAHLLNPGGFLLMNSSFGNTYYYVGEVRFHALPVTRPILESALCDAGLEPILWSILPRGHDVKRVDFTECYFVVAYKMDGRCPFRNLARVALPNMEVTQWCQEHCARRDREELVPPTPRSVLSTAQQGSVRRARNAAASYSGTIRQGSVRRRSIATPSYFRTTGKGTVRRAGKAVASYSRTTRQKSVRRAGNAVASYSRTTRQRSVRRTRNVGQGKRATRRRIAAASRARRATSVDVKFEADVAPKCTTSAVVQVNDGTTEPHHSSKQHPLIVTLIRNKALGRSSGYNTAVVCPSMNTGSETGILETSNSCLCPPNQCRCPPKESC